MLFIHWNSESPQESSWCGDPTGCSLADGWQPLWAQDGAVLVASQSGHRKGSLETVIKRLLNFSFSSDTRFHLSSDAAV